MAEPPPIEDVQRRLQGFRRTRLRALAEAERNGDPVVDVSGKQEEQK